MNKIDVTGKKAEWLEDDVIKFIDDVQVIPGDTLMSGSRMAVVTDIVGANTYRVIHIVVRGKE